MSLSIEQKKSEIKNLVAQYIEELNDSKEWRPGIDWIQYSSPL